MSDLLPEAAQRATSAASSAESIPTLRSGQRWKKGSARGRQSLQSNTAASSSKLRAAIKPGSPSRTSRGSSRGDSRGGKGMGALDTAPEEPASRFGVFLQAWDHGYQGGMLAAAFADVVKEGLAQQKEKKKNMIYLDATAVQAAESDQRNDLLFKLLGILLPERCDYGKLEAEANSIMSSSSLSSFIGHLAQYSFTAPAPADNLTEVTYKSNGLTLAGAVGKGDEDLLDEVKDRLEKDRRKDLDVWEQFWVFYRRFEKEQPVEPDEQGDAWDVIFSHSSLRERIERQEKVFDKKKKQAAEAKAAAAAVRKAQSRAAVSESYEDGGGANEEEVAPDVLDDMSEVSADDEEVPEDIADPGRAPEHKETAPASPAERASSEEPQQHRHRRGAKLVHGHKPEPTMRMNLTDAVASFDKDKRRLPLHRYQGYENVKSRQRILEDIPSATPRARSLVVRNPPVRTGRQGPGLNQMPSLAGADGEKKLLNFNYGTSTPRTERRGAKARMVKEEARLAAEPVQIVRQLAQQPAHEWSPALQQLVSVREWRYQQTATGETTSATTLLKGTATLPPNELFHRPWSREGVQKFINVAEDGYMCPLQRYAKVCVSSGVTPQQAIVRYLGQLTPTLDLRGVNYSDEDFVCLAAAFPYTADQTEAIDIGGNPRVGDEAVCKLLRALEARKAEQVGVLRMDKCEGVGLQSIGLLTQLLQKTMVKLQVLNLSGIHISASDYPPLAEAIQDHAFLREVLLAKTGLGYGTGLSQQVVQRLVANTKLEKLELGYNNLDSETFGILGQGVAESNRLQYLGLACTAAQVGQGSSPMMRFLEELVCDRSLQRLDISNNLLPAGAALILEYAFQKHPLIQQLNIASNPIGHDGVRCLLRLLASEGAPDLANIILQDCEDFDDGSSDVAMGLFDVDPSGEYEMDLAFPPHRVLFKMMLSRLALWGGLKSSYCKRLMLKVDGNESPYPVDNVKQKKGSWQVPTSGTISFTLSLADMFFKDDEDMDPDGARKVTCSAVVDRMERKRKCFLRDQRKTQAVLHKVIYNARPEVQEKLLKALSQDFILSPEQLMTLYALQSDRKKVVGMCSIMMTQMLQPAMLNQVARKTLSFPDLMRFERECFDPLALNLENPAGFYRLDCSVLNERVAVQRLFLVNRWQLNIWNVAKLMDVTEDGNGKCLRNTTLEGREKKWTETDWKVPPGGLLEFDFVPLTRPPKDAPTVPLDTWGRILSTLADLLQVKRSDGEDRDTMKTSSVIWALNAVSARAWILCRQLRSLVCLFFNRDDRRKLVTMFFLRCVDWPMNNKVVQPKFTAKGWNILKSRMGHMNIFPYMQPEMSHHLIDMSKYEQRRCLHVLIRLAASEDIANIRHPVIDKEASGHFQPFVSGIPASWNDYNGIPSRGLFQCTYVCSVERTNPKLRRKMASSIGCWVELPEGEAKLETWSSMDEVPESVVKVITFMIRKWNSIDAAFTYCNAGIEHLNKQEFVLRLAKAGCCKSKKAGSKKAKRAKHHQLQSQEDEYDPDDEKQHHALSEVYRFLDTSNDGDISRKEFENLDRVWRELQQTMYEFKHVMERYYGSLEQAYESIDTNRNGEMSFHEFKQCVELTDFIGPVEQIYMFVDVNGDNSIDELEFLALREYCKNPPLPDFISQSGMTQRFPR
eukprot:TRINITY_DN33555_c0_g1_i1.p1 TRINITY_DN33555_c0_g1~~TRINITY_DN33555_c0_g1_i1.p1  ORF type:complete len:1653 (+),score=370.35 TRINITY_DN33555_c0_g1_i1:89-5047(+)